MEARFSAPVQTGPGDHPSLLYSGYRVFPGGKEWSGGDADSSPLLVPWPRMGRATPLLPLRAVRPVQSLSVCTRVTFTFISCIYLTLHLRALSSRGTDKTNLMINPLNPKLNPICYLLALLGAHHFLHVSRIRVKLLTFRLLMSYIYGVPVLDVSRSHTTTQHSR